MYLYNLFMAKGMEMDPLGGHAEKLVMAGVMDGVFMVAGLFYTPAFLGLIITLPETIRQGILMGKEFLIKVGETSETT